MPNEDGADTRVHWYLTLANSLLCALLAAGFVGLATAMDNQEWMADFDTMFETIFGVMAVTLFVMALLILYKNLKPVVMARV